MNNEELFHAALVDLLREVLDVAEKMYQANKDDHLVPQLEEAANKALNTLYQTLPKERRDALEAKNE